MTREQAREHINNLLPTELTRAKIDITGYPSYICPLCSNGSGENGTGICTKDGKHYKCFVCDFYGDYLDFLKKKYGTDRETDIFNRYNLPIESGSPHSSEPPQQNIKSEIQQTDYTDFFLQAHEVLRKSPEASAYLQMRGISTATADRFKLGYDPEWTHPAAPKSPVTARIIIPISRYSYLARATDPNASIQKQKVGVSPPFNIKALQSKEYPHIFITEGAIDAISVWEVGGQAIALGGVGIHHFIKALKENPPSVPLVLSLDNDKPGRDIQAVLKNHLQTLNIPCIEANISGNCKDPNEALLNDRETFKRLVQDPAKREDKKAAYIQTNSVNGNIDKFMQTISDASATKAIPTGFQNLDKILDGGFYDGLYIVGAVSGIGKTTFILQVADQIAQQNYDVIIFSLEMSKNTLISKSISRLMFEKDSHNALTSRQITSGIFQNKIFLQETLQKYNTHNQNLYIYDGNMGNIGVEQIKIKVREHIQITGNKPIVIIDYLQIMTPCKPKSTDKQNIDNSVLELKQMSMEHKIPVLAVSSFNRDNYLNPVNMGSFKESGAIEYSSDVLLGLQFHGMDDDLYQSYKNEKLQQIEEWQRADTRELELKVLKNRQGASGDNIRFDYHTRFNHFKETNNPQKSKNKIR